MTIGSELFKAHPGMMLITPPGTFHNEDAQTNYSNLHIEVDAPVDMPWPRACVDDVHGSMGTIMETIVREWHSTEPQREAMVQLSLSSLSILVARNAVQPINNTTEMRGVAAKRWIENHFTRPWDTAELAQNIGVSPGHLRDQFQRMYGQSPLEYGRHLRLQKAIALLASSNFTLDKIADLCGYHSPSHLSRHVRETTGQSPGALRPKAPRYGEPGKSSA
jgi:AraC-like DNA-binding protein